MKNTNHYLGFNLSSFQRWVCVSEPVPVGNFCSWNMLERVLHPFKETEVNGWFEMRYLSGSCVLKIRG